MDWYAKKKITVKIKTYGSDYFAARSAVKKLIDLRIILSIRGAP